MEQLEREMTQPDFWDDNGRAQQVIQRVREGKRWISRWEELERQREDLAVLLELAEDEGDVQTLNEIGGEIEELCRGIDYLELQTMLSGEDDPKDAILTIHPGAGGTESQDWAQMLMRMYLRWIERHGYKGQILDLQSGEEAGIKSVTIEVVGDYAYGYLKAENGIHRLVRISPFDANRRRHTSFASVFVYPEVKGDIEVQLDEKDLHIETFRASGAGGQYVNKTSSAVRITHIPTGIVVQCQSERSQYQNKENAKKVLMARLYQYYREQERQKLAELESQKKRIEWGNQIRSYVFHPYTLVKDHRTDVETGDIQVVMDGEIDLFIRAFLIRGQDERPQ